MVYVSYVTKMHLSLIKIRSHFSKSIIFNGYHVEEEMFLRILLLYAQTATEKCIS